MLNACTKDYFNPNNIADGTWNPGIAAPLVNSKLNMENMIAQYDEQNLVQVDANNFISLYYKSKIYSMEVGELVDFPNQVLPKSIQLDATEQLALVSNGSVQADRVDNFQFDAGGEAEITSMNIKSGSVQVSVSSQYQHSGTLTITLPKVTKVGTPFKMVIPLNYSGSVPLSAEQAGYLSSYKMEMAAQGGGNEIEVQYELELENSGNPVLPTDAITMLIAFNDLEFSALFGYLGQHNLAVPADSIDINLFNNSIAGNFTLEDPRFNLIIHNSFGMPVGAEVVKFDAISNSGTIAFNGPNIPGQLNVNSPSLAQIGQSATTEIYLDRNNSNIADILNSKPHQIIYQMNGLGNPDGQTSGNFATDSSKVEMEIEMELPLHGSVSNLVIQDTLDFNFLQDINMIEEAMFRLDIENGFPIEADVQLYFVDANLNILDSLIIGSTAIIGSGVLGSNGKVSQATKKVTDVFLDANRLDNIRQVEKVIIRGDMSTAQQGSVPVKIYSDYTLNVRVGAQTKLALDL